MGEDKNAGQAISFDKDQKPLFSKETETPHATGATEATESAQAAEDDITLPGIERPGKKEVKKEINPNTE